MEKRMNDRWEIVGSFPINEREEVVLAVGGRDFVTWLCKDGTNYFWGHYFDTMNDAKEDFLKRATKEMQIAKFGYGEE